MMRSPPVTAVAVSASKDREASSGTGRSLRLAVVGENADEVGLRLAERHGLASTSMDELMKGRKGRKTDSVKARAASEWLARRGGILTNFPTTAAQADLLDKQGVSIQRLVLVARVGAEGAGGQSPQNTDNEDEGEEEREREEELLAARLAGKVVKLAGQRDVDTLCESAAGLLALGEGEQRSSGEDTFTDEAARLASAAAAEATAALKTADSPPMMLSGADMRMSPAERPAAPKEARYLDPRESEGSSSFSDADAVAAQRARSRAAAEAKRAKKEALRQKKKAANEAQQLDTPFYVAVAQGGPKARFRPPVSMVPSRITERLSSAAVPASGGDCAAANTRLEFGPLVLNSPASDCLLAAGISEPTGIQKAGMGPILEGESVILHAMTGSGKTLTFLLPLMQRWTPGLCSPANAEAAAGAAGGLSGAEHGPENGADGGGGDAPWQMILALPTRELAVQVAREVVLLSGGLTSSVELLVDASVFRDLSKVTAPIVVGSAKVLERLIRKSRPAIRNDVLTRVKCIVVDEVDRLVDVLSKHAPAREAEKRKRHARPIAALLERVLSANGDAQVVACSATIGRPLRRELGHIVRRASALAHVPAAAVSTATATAAGGVGSRELRVIRDNFSESPDRNLATERAVVIPDTIRHYCVPLNGGDFFSRLEGLAAAVRELQPRRPLVFVPPQERVTAVVAHLRRAGGAVGARAVALHEAMGFVSNEDFGGVRGRHGSEAILRHDEVAGQFKTGRVPDSAAAAAAAARDGVGEFDSGGSGDGGSRSEDLLAGRGGAAGRGSSRSGGEAWEAGDVLVTGEDSARGLHFDDVDFVFLMQKPKSPDEYVHLAGRTGRQGKTGTVVSLVEFNEFRKLQGWSNSLKVDFEPLDILNVVKR
eukprot:g10343.t1